MNALSTRRTRLVDSPPRLVRTAVLTLAGCLALILVRHLLLSLSSSRAIEHPIGQLLRQAEQKHGDYLSRRSTSLREAYDLYLERNGRPPPAGYAEWYHASQKVEACNVDEFQQMQRDLEVWWAVPPAEIRDRTDALGGIHALGRVRTRLGKVVSWKEMGGESVLRGSPSEARTALEGMLEVLATKWGVKLPDVDMFVNELDEPRVLISYEARTSLEKAAKRKTVRKFVSEDPDFKGQGSESAWEFMRRACPPSSAARRSSLSTKAGESALVTQKYTSKFSSPTGGFLADPDLERTSWCDQPDLQNLHASFMRPISIHWTKQLFPVFSNSKLHGYNDILIPAWFYWDDHLNYFEDEDTDFKRKANKVFWRGSNTGGRSVGLNWQGWLRSRLVSKLNRPADWAHSETVILADADNKIVQATLPTTTFNEQLADVAFSSTDDWGDESSLESQKKEPSFRFTGRIPFRTNYESKAIFDLDGTAYSGRFVTLMRSQSATFKSRLYIEANEGLLIPWYHYVPISVRLQEVYSVLGYFFGVRQVVNAILDLGKPKLSERTIANAMRGVAHEVELKKIAERGADWARDCARKEDQLSYVYLLVLEWARLLSDDREKASFVLESGEGVL
ncbi:hypothetical protein T439DRAFT_329713 [Meredithblackwellia eburnea MCA 4105]